MAASASRIRGRGPPSPWTRAQTSSRRVFLYSVNVSYFMLSFLIFGHVEGGLDLVWIDCWTRVCYLSDSLWPIWATGSNIHIQLAEERQRGSIPRSVQVRSSAKNYKYKLLLANWQIIRLLLTCSYQNATCCFSECDEKKPSTVKIGNLLIDYVL
jgi:hypothetical protein